MRAQPYASPVEYAGASVRAEFIRRTYNHLAWAVLMRPYELLVVDRFWDARREWHLNSPWETPPLPPGQEDAIQR
jgi:hypothetical protein